MSKNQIEKRSFPFLHRKKEQESDARSLFSLNAGGRISIPNVGEVITLPARTDGSLDVNLEFSKTSVALHIVYEDLKQVRSLWGRFNLFGESGNAKEKPMRHTVVVDSASKKGEYEGIVPDTDLQFKYSKTALGQQLLRLHGPNDTWSLRWNDPDGDN